MNVSDLDVRVRDLGLCGCVSESQNEQLPHLQYLQARPPTLNGPRTHTKGRCWRQTKAA